MYVICVIKAKVGKCGFECVILKPQRIYIIIIRLMK